MPILEAREKMGFGELRSSGGSKRRERKHARYVEWETREQQAR